MIDSPTHPIIPVFGWPGLYIRHSLPRFIAACAEADTDDLVSLTLTSTDALVGVEGGWFTDLGEELGCGRPVQFGPEITDPLELTLHGRLPRDDRERVLALFTSPSGGDPLAALDRHLAALGERAKELLDV